MADHVNVITPAAADTPQELRTEVAAVPFDPAEAFFAGAKWCRFMKDRLLFYATEIAWFETDFLIRDEFGRIVNMFCRQPLQAFAHAHFSEQLSPEEALSRISGSIVPAEVCDGVREFMRVVDAPLTDGYEKRRAREIAEGSIPSSR